MLEVLGEITSGKSTESSHVPLGLIAAGGKVEVQVMVELLERVLDGIVMPVTLVVSIVFIKINWKRHR